MDKEFVKEMIKAILDNEEKIYKSIILRNHNESEFVKAIPKTIELIKNHVDKGYYDIQIEAICDFMFKEIEDKTEEKLKSKNKKKAE